MHKTPQIPCNYSPYQRQKTRNTIHQENGDLEQSEIKLESGHISVDDGIRFGVCVCFEYPSIDLIDDFHLEWLEAFSQQQQRRRRDALTTKSPCTNSHSLLLR